MPRFVLSAFVALGYLALFALGIPNAIAGFGDQGVANHTYRVELQHSHDDCHPQGLHLDLDNGQLLQCTPYGGPTYATRPDLPGFTGAQNDEILALSMKLGAGGLTVAEGHQIQDRIDQIVATVPPVHHSWFWGARRGWLGVAMFIVGAAGLYLFDRTARPKRTPKWQPRHL